MKSVFEEKKVDNLQKQAPEKRSDAKKKAVIKNKDKEKKKRRKEKSSNSQAIDPILLPEQNITEQEKTEIANPTEIVEPIEQPGGNCRFAGSAASGASPPGGVQSRFATWSSATASKQRSRVSEIAGGEHQSNFGDRRGTRKSREPGSRSGLVAF